MNIGIVGARKYKDKKPIVDLVNSLPIRSIIITSGCSGVCSWVKEAVEARGMKVIVFTPDLENINAWFEVPKRYQQRNIEMIEACDFLYAFISKEEGYTGGTRFEIEYALKLGIPVQVHWENGLSQIYYQYTLPFMHPEKTFLLAWQKFFFKTNLEIKGGMNDEMCNLWN